jgi:hypothetical protein
MKTWTAGMWGSLCYLWHWKKRKTEVLLEQGTNVNFLVEFGWTTLQMLRRMGPTTLPSYYFTTAWILMHWVTMAKLHFTMHHTVILCIDHYYSITSRCKAPKGFEGSTWVKVHCGEVRVMHKVFPVDTAVKLREPECIQWSPLQSNVVRTAVGPTFKVRS